jgi:hypothetical protein
MLSNLIEFHVSTIVLFKYLLKLKFYIKFLLPRPRMYSPVSGSGYWTCHGIRLRETNLHNIRLKGIYTLTFTMALNCCDGDVYIAPYEESNQHSLPDHFAILRFCNENDCQMDSFMAKVPMPQSKCDATNARDSVPAAIISSSDHFKFRNR